MEVTSSLLFSLSLPPSLSRLLLRSLAPLNWVTQRQTLTSTTQVYHHQREHIINTGRTFKHHQERRSCKLSQWVLPWMENFKFEDETWIKWIKVICITGNLSSDKLSLTWTSRRGAFLKPFLLNPTFIVKWFGDMAEERLIHLLNSTWMVFLMQG